MKNKRVWIAVGSVIFVVSSVIVKQQMITAKRTEDVATMFSEWQQKGKPVVAERVVRRDISLYTKITVTPVTPTMWEGYVPENIRKELSVAEPVSLSSSQDASPIGTVTAVGTDLDTDTGMYKVTLTIDRGEGIVGVPVVAYITSTVLRSVICVPTSSIVREGAQMFVWRIQGDRAHKQAVTVAQSDGYGMVLSGGIGEGDEIVIEGYTTLIDTDKIARIRSK